MAKIVLEIEYDDSDRFESTTDTDIMNSVFSILGVTSVVELVYSGAPDYEPLEETRRGIKNDQD